LPAKLGPIPTMRYLRPAILEPIRAFLT